MTTELPREVITAQIKNPYKAAILTISIASLVVAGLLTAYASDQANTYGRDATVEFVWAGVLAAIGVISCLIWLVVGAVTWVPSESR